MVLGTKIDQQVGVILREKEEEEEMTGKITENILLSEEDQDQLLPGMEEVIHMKMEDSQCHQEDLEMGQDQIQEEDFEMRIDQLLGEDHRIIKVTEERKENVKYAVFGILRGLAHFIHLVKDLVEVVEIQEDYIANLCAKRELWKIISERNKKMGSLKTFPEKQIGKQIEQQNLGDILLKDQQNLKDILLHHYIPVEENKMSI